MKQLKTIESKVLEILKECPFTRNDDMMLILCYYNRYGFLPAGTLSFEEVIFNYKKMGLPCFESIRRARQRIQSCFPEYSRNQNSKEEDEDRKSICFIIDVN